MFGMIDWIVIGIIIVSVVFALYRGLVRELLGISSWLLAGFAALYSYEPLLKACDGRFENVKIAALIGSVLLALFILIIMTIINAFITRRLRKSSLSGLDRLFGLVFGIARALLILALIDIFAITMILSPKYVEQMKEKNISIKYIQVIADYVQNVFPDNIKKDLSLYQASERNKSNPTTADNISQQAMETLVDYAKQDRDSLENMIESIVEIGDIK